VSAATFDWESQRRRGLRKTVAISTVAHAAVVAVLVLGPALHPKPVLLPSVVTVDLVAAPPAPAPAPRARPAPRPTPRKVVLPASPSRVVAPVPTPKPREKPVEQDYDELLKRLRADAGEDRPEPVDLQPKAPPAPPTPTVTPAPAPAVVSEPRAAATSTTRGVGRRVSPEVAAWVRDARIHVRREWVLAAGFRLQDLETHVEVELDRDGHVIGEPEVTRRSGNPWYDESVVRAIEKADPLPAPPEAGRWPFVFRPEDY
jgi:TonB family protein